MVHAWMADNKSTRWSEGLCFVQMQKNNSFHQGIQQSPFEALFGRKAQWGLTTPLLPASISAALRTEEDVEAALSSIQSIDADDGQNNEEMGTIACISQIDDQDKEIRDELHHQIKRNQAQAFDGLQCQAKRMKVASDAKFGLLDVGTSVTIPVPDIDRSKSDARNIIGKYILRFLSVHFLVHSAGVVMEVRDDFYKIGTKHGVLPQMYARSQVAPCPTEFLAVENEPQISVSLRQASAKSSLVGGQVFVRCHCTQKCQTNRCLCKRKNVCNSKCHNSLSCCNK